MRASKRNGSAKGGRSHTEKEKKNGGSGDEPEERGRIKSDVKQECQVERGQK